MVHHDENEHDKSVTMGDNDSLRTTAAGQLVHLDDLEDLQIADGEPDIRGWDVRGADGTKVGEVEDLLIDTAAMKVRYIEVKLDKDVARDVMHSADRREHEITDTTMRADQQRAERVDDRESVADAGRFVLVPIGVARLDDDDDNVVLSTEAAQMVGIPSYHRESDHLTRDYESEVVRGYDSGLGRGVTVPNDVMNAARPADAQPVAADPFYDDRSFDDRSFFGARRRGRDDDAYFTRADDDQRSRDRQRDAAGSNPRTDDVIDRDARPNAPNEMNR
jgi:sporulation protein YlmC with PRC-barrel domain